jgi:hypothetical protein
MQVFVKSDHNITLTEEGIAELETVASDILVHVSSRLTRVDAQLSDGSAGRSTPNDIHCRIEARPEGLSPQFTTDNGASIDEAFRGALHKMVHQLESTFGKLDTRKGASSMGGVEPK